MMHPLQAPAGRGHPSLGARCRARSPRRPHRRRPRRHRRRPRRPRRPRPGPDPAGDLRPRRRRFAGPAGTSLGRASTTCDADFAVVLRAAGKGEHSALAQIYRAYQPLLLRYLRGQDPSVAEDLAADVWLKVAGGLEGFEGGEDGFRRWLFTIARHRLIEHRRKVARRRTDPVAHDRLDRQAEGGLGRDPATLVLEDISAQDAIDRLSAELSEDQAEVVRLRVVSGLDVGDVARIMDRTPNSVRVLCHRALRRLAERFGEEVMVE